MVVLRKKISVERGQEKLFEEYRYFFYITNDWESSAQEIVFAANDRCDHENLIEQLKNGVKSMRNPLDNLHSNWAYMVMSSLAWTLKAWCGLLLPAPKGPWNKRYESERESILKMEFKRFANALTRLPCQIIRTGRRIVYRLLSWNPWMGVAKPLDNALTNAPVTRGHHLLVELRQVQPQDVVRVERPERHPEDLTEALRVSCIRRRAPSECAVEIGEAWKVRFQEPVFSPLPAAGASKAHLWGPSPP